MKRPVAALDMPGVTPGAPPTARPTIVWVAPGSLLIEPAYQRDLSDASLRLIRRIVEGWDWRRFKPPIAARTAEGLEIIDGQHSAIAAATHGDILAIPVIVVEAEAQVDRAHAFIGHNRDRLGITAVQMHHAALAAGDAEAVKIARVCAAAGVEVVRVPPAGGIYKPRTTVAVAAVRGLVASMAEPDAAWVLRTLADAGFAPVSAGQIQALRHLITAEDFAEVEQSTFARAIAAVPIKQAEREGKEHAAIHRVPAWRGLAAIWFKAARKLGRGSAPRVKDEPRASSDGTVAIPAWVSDDLVEAYCDIAAAEGEEAAAAHVRKAKAGRVAA